MKIGLTLCNDLKISGSSYYILNSLLSCEIIKEVYILKINTNTQKSKFNYSVLKFFLLLLIKLF